MIENIGRGEATDIKCFVHNEVNSDFAICLNCFDVLLPQSFVVLDVFDLNFIYAPLAYDPKKRLTIAYKDLFGNSFYLSYEIQLTFSGRKVYSGIESYSDLSVLIINTAFYVGEIDFNYEFIGR